MAATPLLSSLVCATALVWAVSCENTRERVRAEMPFVVSDAELDRALELLGQSPQFREIAGDDVIYLVDTEVLRTKAEEPEREVLLTHYRPNGDLAVLSRINLQRRRVVSVKGVPHLPVRLSREEFEIAGELALSDPATLAFLDGRKVEFEAQVSRTVDEKDSQFGHRVVQLLLRTPEGYLEAQVEVDLTSREVVLRGKDLP